MLLGFEESKKLLKKYGIIVPDAYFAHSEKEASGFAKKIGYPLVMKASSPDIVHKTELKAVSVDISNEKELKEEYARLSKFKNLEGIILQKQFTGVEMILGIKKDQTFGPVVMAGMGGIFVELFKDVTFRACPVEKDEAKKMLMELKGFKILNGFRGKEKANLEKLADMIQKLSILGEKEDEILGVDLNPVFIDKKGAYIADVRIII